MKRLSYSNVPGWCSDCQGSWAPGLGGNPLPNSEGHVSVYHENFKIGVQRCYNADMRGEGFRVFLDGVEVTNHTYEAFVFPPWLREERLAHRCPNEIGWVAMYELDAEGKRFACRKCHNHAADELWYSDDIRISHSMELR